MNPQQATLRQDDPFRELFGVLRRRKAIVFLTIVLFAILGGVLVAVSPTNYQVSARFLLQDYYNGPSAPSSDPISRVSQVPVAPEIGTQIGLIESPVILEPALRSANVNLNGVDLASQVVEVTQENTTPVLNVLVNLPVPDDASRFAQAIPEAYNTYVQGQAVSRNNTAIASQQALLTTAQTALAKAQKELEAEYARQGPDGVVSAGVGEGPQRSQTLSTLLSQLAGQKVALASAETELQESIAAQSKISKEIRDTRVAPLVERRAAALKEVSDLEGQLRSLLVTLAEANPEVRSVRERLSQARSYLAKIPATEDSTATVRNPERASYDKQVSDSRIKVEALRTDVARLTAQVEEERAKVKNYLSRVPIQRRLETALDQRRTDVAVAMGNLSQIQSLTAKARPPIQVLTISAPYKTAPVVPRTMITAVLLGVIFGVLGALLRDRMDNRIYTLEQIYDVSGAVPLGQVPASTRALGSGAPSGARNRVLESYRSLRFNLESSSAADGAAQSVLVSSASKGEGRAGLSLNLAIEAGTDSRKTILVDADMRTPELHELLKMPRSPGLVEVLSGSLDLDAALQATSHPNVMFLPAGGEHVNPLELLTGPSFVAFHEALKERADVIILNSPSLMRYTDARAIANVADSVLFVAKRGFTRRDAMRYCLGMLRRAKARILGVVMSDDANRTTDVPYFAAE